MPATATTIVQRDLPTRWSFIAPADGMIVSAPGADTRRRVKAKLYSGAIVEAGLGGTPTRFIIDLDSIIIPDKPIAMRHEDHDGRVGVWDRVWVENYEVWGEGYLLTNDEAQRLAQDADDGFPFETSISTKSDPEWLPEGATALVNGRKVVGPAVIGRNALVREASVLTLGADHDTASVILSERSAISMADETIPPTEEAVAETIAAGAITLAWLKENRPDLIAEMSAEPKPEEAKKEEGAPPAEESTEMSQPATLAELKAVAGSDSDLVLWGLENKMTVDSFKATVELTQRRVAAAQATGADPQPSRGAAAPVTTTTGDTATTKLAEAPDKAWSQSAELRAYWEKRGGQSAFSNFVRLCQNEGGDWRKELSGELIAA